MDGFVSICIALITGLLGSGGLVMYWLTKKDSKAEKLDKILETVENHTKTIDQIGDTVKLLADESCETQRYTLNRYYVQYSHQGKITPEQKATWNRVYENYKALGGNHEITVMNEEVQRLEVDPDFDPVSPFAIEWERCYDELRQS